MRYLLCLAIVVVSAGCLVDAAEDYGKKIKPILEAHCYECHGAGKVKGKLRLDSPQAIMQGGREGASLVAGHPEKSPLYQRIVLDKDDDDIMPPKGGPLPAEQIAVIKAWIAAGGDFGSDKGGPTVKAKPDMRSDLDALGASLAAIDQAVVDKLGKQGVKVFFLNAKKSLIEVDASQMKQTFADAQVAALQPLAKHIVWLDLGGTGVTDAGLAKLPSMPHLQKLHLERTAIGDSGMKSLASLKELRYLNLYGSKVTDAGLASLAGLQNLEKLYLWQTAVTAAAAKRFADGHGKVNVDRGE